VVGERPVGEADLIRAVWDAILRLFGEYGASQTGLTLIQYHQEEGLMILRCFHRSVDMVRASIASITEVSGVPVALHVLRVSGTLRSLRRKLPANLQKALSRRRRN